MWVLYNDKGQVVTSIPHGEIIRQGSSASVYIAFQKEYFHSILGEKSVIYSTPKFIDEIKGLVNVGIKYNESTIEYNPEPSLIQFRKLKDNESTLLLEDGKTYLVYKVNLGVEVTRYSGEHKLIVEFYFLNKDNKEIIDKIDTLGAINIYVEPTYDFNENEDVVEKEAAQLILAKMQYMLSNKLNINDEKVCLIEDVKTSFEAFASTCRVKNSFADIPKICLGIIDDGEDINSEMAIGLTDKFNGVTIITSGGIIKKIAGSDNNSSIKVDNDFKVAGNLEVGAAMGDPIEAKIHGSIEVDGDTVIDGDIETLGSISVGNVRGVITPKVVSETIEVGRSLNAANNGVKVTVNTPREDTQAANKGYVDNIVVQTTEELEEKLNDKIEETRQTLSDRISEVFASITGGELNPNLDSIFELVEFIQTNKEEIDNLEETLNNAVAKTQYDDTLQQINQILEVNNDYTFNNDNIRNVKFYIPTTVKQGYMSGFSIKIGSVVPQLNFLNGSNYPILFTLNGTQRPSDKITLVANQTLLGGVMCDGINVYVYLKEMQNGNVT